MRSFLRKIYLYRFFDDFILIYPLYAVMFVEYGVTAFQIALLFIAWSVTTLILEVPSGVLADKYSRKRLLIIAQIIRMFGYACWIFFPNFWGFLAGFILWGIKSALTSGTFEALVYDKLKREKATQQYTKIIGRSGSIMWVAVLSADICASAAIFLGYRFVLILSILSLISASAVLAFLPSVKPTKGTRKAHYFSILSQGIKKATRASSIFLLILFLSIGLAFWGSLEEFWPIFGKEAGLPNYLLGLYLGLISAVLALGSFLAHRFQKFHLQKLVGLFSINGIFLVIGAYLSGWGGLFFLLLFSFIFQVAMIVFEGELQHRIPSKTRATISSIKGLFVEIGAILFYFLFGIWAQIFSYQWAFMIAGYLVIGCGILFILLSLFKPRWLRTKMV